MRKINKADNIETIESLTDRYVELRKQRDNVDEELREVAAQLQDHMEVADLASHKAASGRKVTVVTRTNTVMNEETLRKRLGAQLWNKVTVRKLDKRKLDAFIKSGEVKAVDVAIAMTENEPTTYIKVT